MDTREIGRAIKSLLVNDSEAAALIGNKVFPFPAIEDTDFPFACYMMNGLVPRYTKDRPSFEDTVTMELMIWSEDYGQKIAVANACHKALQGKRGTIEGFDITEIRRTGESEEFMEGAYGQSIIYEIDINTYK